MELLRAAPATRRGTVVVLGLLGALVVGGISQTFLWRWGLGGLGRVVGSQFTWFLLAFGISWAWADGRVARGAAAGGLTGLALIVSYYATQWLADGRHAAVAQLYETGGYAWTLAAVGGGALTGLLGAMASMEAGQRPRLKAFGIVTPAVIAGAGPALWMMTNGAYLDVSGLLPAVGVFALVACVLLGYAVRTCGPVASAQVLAMSTGMGVVALLGLLWLQTHGGLYLTF